jgi:alpha-mannosidase
MKPHRMVLLVGLLLAQATMAAGQDAVDASQWTIYITNDTCFDYTWALNEEESRQSAADLMLSHLDEMSRTDTQKPESRDCFNMPVTQQALCFIERYPERKAELVRRIKEDRVYVGPFLNNTLWGFQSVESAIRSFYPDRRLEKEWGIRTDVADHIELPSLPWGVASILAGCGFRWLVIPFLNYDSTFSALQSPPLFTLEGPDGSRIRVVMDSWASLKAAYGQGATILKKPEIILDEWVPHYAQLGNSYPLRALLASGTHSDLSLTSSSQTEGFASDIIQYNKRPDAHPTLVNATFPQFCKVADKAEDAQHFLPVIRGSFGHSWELWPVTLAKYVAALRVSEQSYLAAETLLALAALRHPEVLPASRSDRLQAEWNWTMLADHAWNGANDGNRIVNADLRRRWSEELGRLAESVWQQAWTALGLHASDHEVTIFNSLSIPRADLVRIPIPQEMNSVLSSGAELPSQVVKEDGDEILYFVSPKLSGFDTKTLQLQSAPKRAVKVNSLRATDTELESPYYRLRLDPATGGLASLVYKPSATELVVSNSGRTLGQLVFFDGKEHTLAAVKSEVEASGPVLARTRITGTVEGIEITTFITVYAGLDRVDFDTRIKKPVTAQEQRLTQIFPVTSPGSVERIEDMGAVIRFHPQPEGDLLPGADTRRAAVQDFVDVSLPQGPGVTLAPLEAFALRNDLDPVSFEILGNDQNYKEVTKDQNGATDFRFRFSLRAHPSGFSALEASAWSRGIRSPLIAVPGNLPEADAAHGLVLDSSRAISTCLKPADDPNLGGTILRIWEVAGKSGPLDLRVRGFRRAFQTDLLERNLRELHIVNGKIKVDLRGYGYGAVRLLD